MTERSVGDCRGDGEASEGSRRASRDIIAETEGAHVVPEGALEMTGGRRFAAICTSLDTWRTDCVTAK